MNDIKKSDKNLTDQEVQIDRSPDQTEKASASGGDVAMLSQPNGKQDTQSNPKIDKNADGMTYIKKSRLFAHLPDNLVQELIPLSRQEDFPRGTTILKEGRINGRIYFLMNGTVGVYSEGEFILDLKRIGDTFGEMSVIRNLPCSVSIVAKTPVRVFYIEAHNIGQYTDISGDLLHNMIYRVFSMILTEKLSLTTEKAKQYEIEHKKLLQEIEVRKEVETQLREAKDEAEIANQIKDEFMANMSHELRTPLNVITGFVELLYPLLRTPQEREYLKSIKLAGKNLLTLINDILDISRMGAGKLQILPSAVDLRKILHEIEYIFKRQAMEKGLKFSVNVDEKVPDSLILDKVRLRQILFNLTGNAVKFTEKGQVSIAVCAESKPNGANSTDLTITIADTGIGIPIEQQERIFELFIQQDGKSTRKFGGTGLGLAICERLCGIMNGELTLESTVGAGSTFMLKLRDVKAAERPAPQMDAVNIKKISFDNAKILVVDDIEPNRLLLEKILSRNNATVFSAQNGLEAISRAVEKQPDLIVMDIMMPVMDGIESTKRLKENEKTSHIPVVALTAYLEEGDQSKLLDNGFAGCLFKPVDFTKLFRELETHLQYSVLQ